MKKYTKRLLAFLLATAMVLTGLPMNAKEVKAADESITYDLCTATTGVVTTTNTVTADPQTYGETLMGMDDATTKNGGYFVATTSLAGDGWNINNDKTTAQLTDIVMEDGSTVYRKAQMSGTQVGSMHFQAWSGSVRCIAANKGKALAFDFTVPEAGTYSLIITNYNHTAAYAVASILVNDIEVQTMFAGYDSTREKAYQDFAAGTVELKEGTNTIVFKSQNIRQGYMLRSFTIAPIGYGSASINLEEDATFLVGDTLALNTTATLNTGAAIESGLSVAYASNNEAVATVTDGTLAIVGAGAATITAEVSYNGVVEEVLTRNITAEVPGTFHLYVSDADPATYLKEDGKSRWYMSFELLTKTVAEPEGVAWVINTEKSAESVDYGTGGTTGRIFMDSNDAPYYIRLMNGNQYLALDFEAPAAGEYNVSIGIPATDTNCGYVSVFVNDMYIGSADGYTGSPNVQNLLAATLVEGTNTIKFIAQGKSSGTDDYISIGSFHFEPTNNNARKITSLEALIDNDRYALDLNGNDVAYANFNATTNTDDVIILGDYTYSIANPEIATVARTGKITAKEEGKTELVVTMGDVSASVPFTVADTRPRYTITWLNEGGTELEVDDNLLEGTKISYNGETPVKEGNAQYSYTFAGWTPEVAETVTGDATYTATYTETVNEYKVTFMVNGEVAKEETLAYGATPVAPEVNPYEEEGVSYSFTGWDAEIVTVTGDVTYTAVFEAAAQSYTITFVDEDGTSLYETQAEAGVVVTYPYEAPTKAGNAQYTYTFAGWTVDGETLVEDFTVTVGTEYKAVYTETVNEYEIIFADEDGTELSKATYAYGATPVEPEAPVKEADAQYTYTFAGWDKEVVAVEGEATYTAKYEATVNEYEVIFLDEDGTELSKATYAYGATPVEPEAPVKEATAQYTYTFAGWDKDVVAVEGEATYTAKYDAVVNEYEITFVDEDGTELSKAKVAYGEIPACEAPTKEADAQYTYTFAGWTPAIVAVEGEATYTATYEATEITYAITWLNHNGEVIRTDALTYGATPEAPAASYKEYTFLSWDKDIVAVEGEATYIAIYDIDGIDEGYYYVDGKVKGNAGVIQIGEDLYFVCYSGKIAAGQNMTVPANKTNNLVAAGTYSFYADGTMKNPADELKGEIVNVDGTLWYYVKGEVRGNVGLVKIDGLCYYVHYSGKVVAGTNQTVTKTNGFAEAGTYYFYANGVMATDEVKLSGEVVDGYYYVYDELTKNVGLVQLANGDFVYVHYSGKVVQNGYQTVTEAKANDFTEFVGVRKFADGIMIH